MSNCRPSVFNISDYCIFVVIVVYGAPNSVTVLWCLRSYRDIITNRDSIECITHDSIQYVFAFFDL